MTDWAERLRIVVRQCFPSDARVIRLPTEGDLVFAISWKLSTDPNRPLKRSKTVRLQIDEGTVVHYAQASEAHRKTIDTRLAGSLRESLSQFNPDHRASEGRQAPVVNWHINGVGAA